jgi:hypothetical protein
LRCSTIGFKNSIAYVEERVPDSPDHTTKWVIGFLSNQENLARLVELHRSISQVALERSIPRLVSIFDNVEPIAVREEWQRAIASLCLFWDLYWTSSSSIDR